MGTNKIWVIYHLLIKFDSSTWPKFHSFVSAVKIRSIGQQRTLKFRCSRFLKRPGTIDSTRSKYFRYFSKQIFMKERWLTEFLPPDRITVNRTEQYFWAKIDISWNIFVDLINFTKIKSFIIWTPTINK